MSHPDGRPRSERDECPRRAHSLAEAKLYLLASTCPACGRGPIRAVGSGLSDSREAHGMATVEARCDACGDTESHRFTIPAGEAGGSIHQSDVINPTSAPSELLDVGQWIVLGVMLLESAEHEPDTVNARQLRIEAGLCLDEAVKFYADQANDLPPPTALFSPASRRRFEREPQQFSRQRLRSMRINLPRPGNTR